MMEQYDFEKLIMFLASQYEKGDLEFDEEVVKFEDAIKVTGCGEAYFGIAKSDWDRIEIVSPEYIPFAYKKEGAKFYAEYYDGMQAPFMVCKWCDDFDKLIELLKNTSDVLYQKYQEIVGEIMSSDDYQFLYAKLESGKIPDDIHTKIIKGEDLDLHEEIRIKAIIEKEKLN